VHGDGPWVTTVRTGSYLIRARWSGVRGGRGIGGRHKRAAPLEGTPPLARHTGLPSVHLNLSERDKPVTTRLPRLIARGYPAAVPDSMSVVLVYAESAQMTTPLAAAGPPCGEDRVPPLAYS
jgi:hypothetical protein